MYTTMNDMPESSFEPPNVTFGISADVIGVKDPYREVGISINWKCPRELFKPYILIAMWRLIIIIGWAVH